MFASSSRGKSHGSLPPALLVTVFPGRYEEGEEGNSYKNCEDGFHPNNTQAVSAAP